MKKLLFFFSLITSLAWGMSDEPMLGFTPLHKVTTPQEARALIESGAEVNKKAAWRLTPLHLMVIHYAKKDLSDLTSENQKEITELEKIIFLLIKKGADLTAKTKDGELPLDLAGTQKDNLLSSLFYAALVDNNALVIKIVCKHGYSLNGVPRLRPLHYAINYHRIDVLKILLEEGANPHLTSIENKDAFSYAEDKPEILSILMPYHKLAKAMRANSLEDVQKILQTNTTIHPDLLDIFSIPQIKKLVRMHYAFQLVTQDNWRALEKLIKNGLDVNGKKDGEPLLHRAVKKDKVDTIKLLLRFEVDPYITNDKEQDTFLFAKNDETRKLLMDCFLKTPLARAMKTGSLEKVKKLLPTTKVLSHHLAIETTPEIKALIKKSENAKLVPKVLIASPESSSNQNDQWAFENYLSDKGIENLNINSQLPTLRDLPRNL